MYRLKHHAGISDLNSITLASWSYWGLRCNLAEGKATENCTLGYHRCRWWYICLAGGNVTVSLNGKVIGTAAFSPKLQTTHRRKLLQLGLLTSLFDIPLTIPLGTPAGLQVSHSPQYQPACRRCTAPAPSLSHVSGRRLSLDMSIFMLPMSVVYFDGKKIVISAPAMCDYMYGLTSLFCPAATHPGVHRERQLQPLQHRPERLSPRPAHQHCEPLPCTMLSSSVPFTASHLCGQILPSQVPLPCIGGFVRCMGHQ